MIKKYIAFSLAGQDYDFTLIPNLESKTGTPEFCQLWIEKTLKDYKSRKVKDGRFVILPVFYNENDTVFDYAND